jgi:hypothetical protein
MIRPGAHVLHGSLVSGSSSELAYVNGLYVPATGN